MARTPTISPQNKDVRGKATSSAATAPLLPSNLTTDVLLLSTYELGRQPFGLASPAAWLRGAGARVTCADLSIEDFPAAAASAADLVAFFLPMHTATRLAAPLIPRIREFNPNAHICCYGLYGPTNAAYLNSLGVQTVIGGEFETGLLRLCDGLSRNRSDPGAGDTHISLDRQQFEVPDRSGLPELSRYAELRTGDGQPRIVGYTEASRGCKHLCRHCPVVPVYNGIFRIVQADVVLADVERQVEAGAGHITFGDPDFFNGIGHAVAIVEGLHERFPELSYDVTIKIEHLLKYADRIPLLRDTGCAFVTSAVESSDDRVLELLEKNHTREDFIRVATLFRDNDFVLNPTFVTFSPWTTISSYIDLLELTLELELVDNVAAIQWAIRLLIPAGSRLLELAETKSILLPYAADRLGYPWAHPDPEVDELFDAVFEIVCRSGDERRETFARVWDAAHRAAGSSTPQIDRYLPTSLSAIPYLTEPWYC